MPSFRVREPERDRRNDVDRLQRVRQLISQIRSEMEREQTGLRDRYERISANAAFSIQALENDGGGAAPSEVNTLTETMISYTKRIASLDAQLGFVTDLKDRIEVFLQESAMR